MMLYVTDTHSLVWYLSEDYRLSVKAKEIFEYVEKGNIAIIIPTIVLAELFYICENKGLLNIFYLIIEKIKEGSSFIAYNLDLNIIVEFKDLLNISEMHDRIIVATARLLKADVITKDEEIEDSGYVKTVW